MLVLTSYGFRVPAVSNKLKYIIETEGKSVLIVPFAGFNNESCAEREKEGLIAFGFDEENIYVYDSDISFNNVFADYIYVPGGNTFKLLYEMQQCGAIDVIKDMVNNGSVYIGASAGAEVATSDIEYVTALEDNNYQLESFEAIGFIDDVIIPHSDQREISQLLKAMPMVSRKRLPMGIPNDGVYVYQKNQWGEYTYVDCTY